MELMVRKRDQLQGLKKRKMIWKDHLYGQWDGKLIEEVGYKELGMESRDRGNQNLEIER